MLVAILTIPGFNVKIINHIFAIFAAASLIRPAPVELPQDRKVARVNG